MESEFAGVSDDLFAEPTQKKLQVSDFEYKPKVLTPKWFENESCTPPADLDKVQFHVFQGDHNYYQGRWVPAADAYARALGHVAPNNRCMRRLLLESLARCRLRCGDLEGAVKFGEKLLEESTSENQLFTAHSALATLYGAAGKTKEEMFSLRYCLDVRPQSVQHLIQLAKAYLKQRQLSWTNCRVKDQRSKVKATEHASKGGTVGLERLGDGDFEGARTRGESNKNSGDEARTDSKLKSKCNCVSLASSDTRSERDMLSKLSREKRCSRCELPECYSGQAGTQGVQVSAQNDSGSSENTLCNNHGCSHSPLRGSAQIPNSRRGKSDEVYCAEEKEHATSLVSRVEEDMRTLSFHENAENGLQDNSDGAVDEPRDGEGTVDGALMREIATCLIRARQALKVDQLAAVSLAKKRNGQLLLEVESLLQSLDLDAATLEEIAEQISEKQDS